MDQKRVTISPFFASKAWGQDVVLITGTLRCHEQRSYLYI